MRSSVKTSIATLTLFACARASPVPQDVTVIGFQGQTDLICGITYDDPENAWRNSGAAVFLDKWLTENGEYNWANKIDQQTTDGGSQGTAVVNCLDFDVGNCLQPTTLCKQFTPPELWHVRRAMANAYGIIKAMYEAFERSVIKEKLNAGNVISDFGPAPAPFNIFGVMNAAFTIAAGATAASVPIAGPATIMAGIFGILASQSGGDTIDLAGEIDSQLAAALDKAEEHTRSMLKLVFGGQGDTSTLPGVNQPGSNGEKTNIAKFFSGGKFLFKLTPDASIDDSIKPLITQGALMMRQRLVTSILNAQGYYIWVDTKIKEQGKCSGASARWIDNACFQLHKFHPERNGHGYSEAIEDEKINKFEAEDAGYNLNVEWFYRYSDACQQAKGYDGEMDGPGFPSDGSTPLCFFNLPVLKADNVCDLREQVPERLGLTKDACVYSSVGCGLYPGSVCP